MTIVFLAIAAYVVLLGAKACHSAALHDADPEAWDKWQRHEDENRRRRQLLLGQTLRATFRTVAGWCRRDDTPAEVLDEEDSR